MKRVFLLLLLCGTAPVFSQAPQLGQPTLLQLALNRLPEIPIPNVGKVNFQFGGEVWIAKLDGKNLLAGTIEVHETNEGSILVLKQTHIYAKIAWVKTPGAGFILEYKKGPPASINTISRSDMDAKLASGAVVSATPAGQAPSNERVMPQPTPEPAVQSAPQPAPTLAPVPVVQPAPPPAAPPVQPAPTYKIGDRGPAGGIVFYDKGQYMDGWRYLEAAPADLQGPWGLWEENAAGTEKGIGSGKRNTELIIAAFNQKGESGRAAQLCKAYTRNGFSDWFLPSKDELNLMYTNLRLKNLGGFRTAEDKNMTHVYCSSSQGNNNYAWGQKFSDGFQGYISKNFAGSVRAVRAF